MVQLFGNAIARTIKVRCRLILVRVVARTEHAHRQSLLLPLRLLIIRKQQSTADNVRFSIPCNSNLTIKDAKTNLSFSCGENSKLFSANDSLYLKFTNSLGSAINTTATLVPVVGGVNYNAYLKLINFTVAPSGFLTILSPNGGETLEIDKTYTIIWNHNIAGNFEAWIDLLKGGVYYGSIAGGDVRLSSAQNITSYSWRVGDMKGGVVAGNDYQVRITYNDVNTGVTLTDTSNSYFSIIAAPSVTVVYPDGGEKVGANQTHIITWKSSGVDKVILYACYTSNSLGYICSELSGIPTGGIAASLGTYSWWIDQNTPYIPGNVKIKIVDAKNSTVYDESDNYLAILGLETSNLVLCPDVNKDAVVNVLDLIIVGQLYDIYINDSRYNQLADLNLSGCINKTDADILGQYLNQNASQIPQCSLGGAGLNNIEKQLADISKAIDLLMEEIKKLLGL
jgi:hypothetical protein